MIDCWKINKNNDEKFNEITNAIKQMQNSIGYLMQNTNSTGQVQHMQYNNSQYPPHNSDGYQENHFQESNQHQQFPNNQHVHFEEPKNGPSIPHTGFRQ